MTMFLTFPRVAAAVMSATCVHVAAAQVRPSADTAVAAAGPSLLRMSAGVVLGVTVAQVINAPEAWPRTAGGAARRLADQSGFVALRVASHRGLTRAVPWTASREPCPVGIAARTWCAVTHTLVVHDRHGAPRPDVARIGSLAIASFGSLLWRPERAARGDASLFVLSRVGSGLLIAAIRRGVGARGRAAHE